jgi:hypothetical protein
MKVGDGVPVTIANDVVAQARVVEIDREGNTATMIVPATRVVMALKVELDTTPTVTEPEKEVIITGVDRVDGEGNVIGSTEVSGESAPVSTNTENDAEITETPEGSATQTELVEAKPAETQGE